MPEVYREKTRHEGPGFRNLERETRFELATPTLARLCSTTELFPPDQRGRILRIRTGSSILLLPKSLSSRQICVFFRLQLSLESRVAMRKAAKLINNLPVIDC